ncbi:hypothetical protein [Pseudomonas sp. B22129]|uniref:hypothetical protein n=1 Tax=Pseudomonas sp. B22129 TaxID=3235111 RepID=UPI0037836E07
MQHHWRIADGHELRAFEHVHQGQRTLGFADGNGAAWFPGGNRRHKCDLFPDFEHLFDIQCRAAPEAFGPFIKGVQATPEITKDAFSVGRLGIHGRQHKPGNDRSQKTAPMGRALTEKYIGVPSH